MDEIIELISLLANNISDEKWDDEENHVINVATDEDYGTLRDFYKQKMQELFDIEVE